MLDGWEAVSVRRVCQWDSDALEISSINVRTSTTAVTTFRGLRRGRRPSESVALTGADADSILRSLREIAPGVRSISREAGGAWLSRVTRRPRAAWTSST